MIIVVHSWTCTNCGHGTTFDPSTTTPPETCTACELRGSIYKAPFKSKVVSENTPCIACGKNSVRTRTLPNGTTLSICTNTNCDY